MSGHTELPWQASGVRVRLDGQPMLQATGPKGVVAYVPYSDLTPKDHLESHGDLNLIVKACNSHDALVAVLRPFIEALPGYEHAKLIDKRYGDLNPIQATVTKAQMKAAREALRQGVNMPREVGPREKVMREQREAAFAENQTKLKAAMPRLKAMDKLADAVAVASAKRGKARKVNK